LASRPRGRQYPLKVALEGCVSAQPSFCASDKLPWGTIIGGIIVLIVALIGGIVTIVEPKTLSFSDYVSSLSDLAVGVGLVAVGRGVTKAGKHVAKDNVSR
jgi:hypothetical protein